MTIKHLVLSGGGPGGITIYGALKYLSINRYYNYTDIESIHSVSAGSLIACLIMLSDTWDEIDDYIIKRPWSNLISISPTDILDSWENKGLFDETIIKEIVKPFILAKNLDLNISLSDFYNLTNIDLYIYTTELNIDNPISISLSHKSHPNLSLVTAIVMSASYPIIFKPVIYDDNFYIDGGFLNNFPINECIKLSNKNEILGFNIISNNSYNLTKDTTLPFYMIYIIEKLYNIVCKIDYDKQNVVECFLDDNSFEKWKDALVDSEIRKNLINFGYNSAKQFLDKLIIS